VCGHGPVVGSCKQNNEPSGSLSGGELLYQLGEY
jgi:hypothetical protein